jgi:hypothetical protein
LVTLSLANGKTFDWVADRTGHKSTGQIATYKQAPEGPATDAPAQGKSPKKTGLGAREGTRTPTPLGGGT